MSQKVAKYSAEIEFNTKVSSKVYHTRIKLLEPRVIDFAAGQFANINVGGNLRRSYSISSSPDQRNYFETFVDVSPGGPGSKFFAAAVPGTPVDLLAPLGPFIFKDRDDDLSPVIFLATGTGITPFVAMLYEQLKLKSSRRKFILFWGLRYQEDLFWEVQLADLAGRFPNFNYLISLSKPTRSWAGLKGYCTELLLDKWNKIDNISKADFYLCGAGNMLDEAKLMLGTKGISNTQIFHEKFY